MRIISKFHDYYDCVLRQGIDKEIVYVRLEEEGAPKLNLASSSWRAEPSWTMHVVGFCGKLHFGLRIVEHVYGSLSGKVSFIYGNEEIKAWLKEHDFKIWRLDDILNQKVSEPWKHPTFVCEHFRHGVRSTWNNQLKRYEFQRAVDPFTAFQELQMWVGAQARPEREMVETSDETRLEARGFDKKFSFRKSKK